jgi:hypothetical protein
MFTTGSWDGWGYSYWSISNVVNKRLVASVAEPVESSRQFMRVHTRSRRGNQAMLWLVCILFWGIALGGLYFAWRDADFYDWLFVWTASIGSVLMSVLLFIFAWWESRRRRQHAAVVVQEASGAIVPLSVRAIRRAVLRGDDTLAARLVPVAPEAIVSGTPPPITLSVLPPQQRFQRDERLLSAFNAGLFSMIFALQSLTILTLTIFTTQTQQLPLLLLFSAVFILNLARFVALRRAARPVRVEVHEDGLRWRIGREQLSLPWSEARGWCVLFLPATQGISWGQSAWRPVDAVYTVIGEHTSLPWLYQQRATKPAQASRTLAALVDARVGLPLRDMTQGSLARGGLAAPPATGAQSSRRARI